MQSARAALAGGASWLAVAGARERRELREAGLADVRVLVMGALSAVELARRWPPAADVVVWNEDYLQAVAAAGGGRVHVKLDSGMGRLGTRDPRSGQPGRERGRSSMPGVELAGVMTHFATADELDDEGFFAPQLAAFTSWAAPLKASTPQLIVHAANSAAMLRERERPVRHGPLRHRRLRHGSVRQDPGRARARAGARAELLRRRGQALRGRARAPATGGGSSPSATPASACCRSATATAGGAALSNNADVLIGGRRHPLVGTVSMDSITVDLGPDAGPPSGCAASARS